MPNLSPKRIWYLGIDPGAQGGLAAVYYSPPEETRVVSAINMPDDDGEIGTWLDQWASYLTLAIIEQVQGYMAPQKKEGDGFVAGSAAMFNFGVNYGALRMALRDRGIPFTEIRPQAWQKALGVTPRLKKETKTKFKNRLLILAKETFPTRVVTLHTADALLLAEYCRKFKPLPESLTGPKCGII